MQDKYRKQQIHSSAVRNETPVDLKRLRHYLVNKLLTDTFAVSACTECCGSLCPKLFGKSHLSVFLLRVVEDMQYAHIPASLIAYAGVYAGVNGK